LASVSPTVAGSKPKKLLDQTRDVLRLKPARRKILRVVKRSALRKARSVPSFDARRNSSLACHADSSRRSRTKTETKRRRVTSSGHAGESVGGSKTKTEALRRRIPPRTPGEKNTFAIN
jgi:hypothetical protein